jgi:hypothetical protein
MTTCLEHFPAIIFGALIVTLSALAVAASMGIRIRILRREISKRGRLIDDTVASLGAFVRGGVLPVERIINILATVRHGHRPPATWLMPLPPMPKRPVAVRPTDRSK